MVPTSLGWQLPWAQRLLLWLFGILWRFYKLVSRSSSTCPVASRTWQGFRELAVHSFLLHLEQVS
jgi:hypothetical protein